MVSYPYNKESLPIYFFYFRPVYDRPLLHIIYCYVPICREFRTFAKNFFKLPNNSDIPIQYRNKDWIRHRAESDKKTMWKYTRSRKML